MELNIQQTMEGILDWDFSLVHSGRSVATRPLTLGDLGRLVAMSSKGKPKTDTPVNPSEIFKSVLAEDGPEIDAWIAGFRFEEIYASLDAVAKYAGWVMSKNSQAIDPAIERAMATLCSPSGSSTPV